jgi:GTP-binding protein HflX
MADPSEKGGGGVDFQIEGPDVTRAFVIHPDVKSGAASGGWRDAEAKLEEAVGLTLAIELEIAEAVIVPLQSIQPGAYFGSGKVAELGERIHEAEADLVILNGQLSPAQQRNLERAWKTKVLDRTGLILEIFGRRANTREGTLQVELAHLNYQKSRLVRSWTHLERQRGGAGFMGGPGETQIEADRRIIQDKINRLKKQLDQVVRTRTLHRQSRAKVPYPVVALVGYTNAGKSTLFNRLTDANVMAKDLLFATLDPTMRQIELPRGRKVILSDTVGFISDLPTTLVAAFRATLEEVLAADVILHVRDISHPETEEQAGDVLLVLKDLGVADKARDDMIEVWNKIDLLSKDDRATLVDAAEGATRVIPVSAVTGEGVDKLLERIEAALAHDNPVYSVELAPEDGAELAWIYGHGEVLDRHDDADTGQITLTARFEPRHAGAAVKQLGERLKPLNTEAKGRQDN